MIEGVATGAGSKWRCGMAWKREVSSLCSDLVSARCTYLIPPGLDSIPVVPSLSFIDFKHLIECCKKKKISVA